MYLYIACCHYALTQSPPGKPPDPNVYLYIACCHYALTQYQQAEEFANKATGNDGLKKRLLFQTAHKTNEEAKMMQFHTALSDSVEDQL